MATIEQQGQQGTLEDHFNFFRSIYDYANQYYVVKKLKETYGYTKHSCGVLERTLDNLEGHASEAVQFSAPLYEHYVFPTANRFLELYGKSIENTKSAVDTAVNAAITSSTVGVGIVMVAAQMGLIAGTAATNKLLDGVIATRNVSSNAVMKAISLEKFIEHCISDGINKTFELAKSPTEKLNEHAHNFLDMANKVFEQLLSLPEEKENADGSLVERIAFLSRRIASGVNYSANQSIIETKQKLTEIAKAK